MSETAICEYVYDPDDPTQAHGTLDESALDDELLTQDGVWTCPHESGAESDLCVFHRPVEEKDDAEVVDAFLEAVSRTADSTTASVARSRQFVGARFGAFELSESAGVALGQGRITLASARFQSPVDWSGAATAALDLRGAVFAADADFKRVTFEEGIDLAGARFEGRADFGRATFANEADFSSTTFEGEAEFRSATFERCVAFEGVRFAAESTFRLATFERESEFEEAVFDADSTFEMATFEADATFRNAAFSAVNFRSGTFETDSKFKGATFAREADFSKVRFDGAVSFWNAAFDGSVDFDRATFDSGGFFEGTAFGGEVSFQSPFSGDECTEFGGKMTFSRSEFADDVDFTGAVFRAGTNLRATFQGDVRFSKAVFEGETTLRKAEFAGSAEFDRSSFDADVNFGGARFESDSSFENATFDGDARFETPESGVITEFGGTANFKSASFGGAAVLRDVHFRGKAIFTKATFETPPTFSRSRLDGADFEGIDLADARFRAASLTNANVPEITARGADFSEAHLERANIENADLTGANLERAKLSNADLFGADLSGARLYGSRVGDIGINTETVFDGHGTDRCVYDPRSTYEYEPDSEENVDRLTKAMGTYNLLEDIARSNTLPDKQATFFARRQDMRRAQLRRDESFPRLDYWFAVVQNAVFRHGEGFSRVVAWALGTIVAFTLVYPAGGWLQTESAGAITYGKIAETPLLLWKSFHHSALLFSTGESPLTTVGIGGEVLVTIESMTAPVLLALLVFVLGRRAAR
ncbi:pentapeptide repeat-containing protein [Halobellus sp. GM3]|uniref:pentapeptide repeat-containing protein n=1 Tax=Halobellus sp. GM3 TaxID=3458410 RepID=UPI00403DA570